MKKFSSNLNLSSHQTEEKNFPYYRKIENCRFFPLVTRQNLKKYLNQNCYRQKSLPVINGKSYDKEFKLIPKYKTPSLTRNMSRNQRCKISKFYTDEKNRNLNVSKLYPIEERKNEIFEGCDKTNDVVKENRDEKLLYLDNMNNIFYKPKKKTNFRKVQIFNHFKPFLVDEFREFASL